MMLKALTTAGIGPIHSLYEMMDLAAQNGFDSIDLPIDFTLKAVEQDGLDAVKEAFAKKQLTPGVFGIPVSWSEDTEEGTFLHMLEESEKVMNVMQALGCKACTTYLMPGCNGNPEQWKSIAAERIAKMDKTAQNHGLRFGVEYTAPKHLIARYAHPFVHTAAEMLDLLKQSGSRAGLVLDSIHWFSAGENVQTILSLPAEQIVHVHLNDTAYADPIDHDRLYPGEGIIPLRDFLTALRQIGYQGGVTLEVLTPVPQTDAPTVLIKRAAAGFAKVWPSEI